MTTSTHDNTATSGDVDIDAFSYLKAREREIVNAIFTLAKSGKPDDRIRLEAYKTLFSKIRADRHHTTVDGNASMSPMEAWERVIRENIDKNKEGKK